MDPLLLRRVNGLLIFVVLCLFCQTKVVQESWLSVRDELFRMVIADHEVSAEGVAYGDSALDALRDRGSLPLNCASSRALRVISGIGEKRATAIVEERSKRGDFGSLKELTRVKGIGQKTIGKWSSLLETRTSGHACKQSEAYVSDSSKNQRAE